MQEETRMSLEDLISWLEEKDPAVIYQVGSPEECLMAQYISSRQPTFSTCTSGRYSSFDAWKDQAFNTHLLPEPLATHAQTIASGDNETITNTYEAALMRARRCLAHEHEQPAHA